jgi:hypothetical protein
MDHPELFVPDPALAEEWDNPEMTAFKWQEAAERVAFAKSHTQEEWLAAMKYSMLPEGPIRVAPQPRDRFPFKVIRLPW